MFMLDSSSAAVNSFNESIGKFVGAIEGFFSNIGTFFDAFFKDYIGWVMIAVAVIFCINAVLAYKASEIARAKGYDEDKYLSLGFFFGIFVLIRANLLKNRLNAK